MEAHLVARTAQSDEQVPPTLMDGASSNGSALPTPTRRRRLVVEVAPNVVDVSAVALPGSPLIVTNVESDGEGVPAEEDELDTRNQVWQFWVRTLLSACPPQKVQTQPWAVVHDNSSAHVTQASQPLRQTMTMMRTMNVIFLSQDVVLALESDLAVGHDCGRF